eukprot:2241792-Prymnesium_polylepis.1
MARRASCTSGHSSSLRATRVLLAMDSTRAPHPLHHRHYIDTSVVAFGCTPASPTRSPSHS